MGLSVNNDNEWLTLGEASRLVGVHPATIRQWSDEGKIGAFRTPGGHRRFARTELERLLHMTPVRGHGLSSYVVEETVERTRRGLAEGVAHATWAQSLSEEQLAHWRAAGRRLLALVSQLATKPSLPTGDHAMALGFGRDYGRMMARIGHSLPDAVIAFLYFRDSLLSTVLQLPETTGLDRSSTLQIVSRVNLLLNEVLQEMMRAWESETAALAARPTDVVDPSPSSPTTK